MQYKGMCFGNNVYVMQLCHTKIPYIDISLFIHHGYIVMHILLKCVN